MLNHKIKILIAETSLNKAILTQKYLGEYGLPSSTVCGDGIDALRWFNEEDFDLLIINWMLPGISAEDLIHTARLLKEDKKFSTLAILPQRKREMITRVIDLNIEGYLISPVTSDCLYEKISPIIDTLIPENMR